jgi:hypothetical protein
MKTIAPPTQETSFTWNASRAIGEESKGIALAISGLRIHLVTNISFGKPKSDALAALDEVVEEASEYGWDCHSAEPVKFDAYMAAKRFIDLLPVNLPAPDVSADPDGDISLEWYRTDKRMFWVSINAYDFVHYVGSFGSATMRGGEVFVDEIPRTVINGIKRVYA